MDSEPTLRHKRHGTNLPQFLLNVNTDNFFMYTTACTTLLYDVNNELKAGIAVLLCL